LDLLHLIYSHNSGLHVTQRYCYSTPFLTHQDSVFTSRILATYLSQSHCHFKSHMKSSWQSGSLLAISSQSPSTAISRVRPNSNSSRAEHSRAEQSTAMAYSRQPASTVTPGIEPRCVRSLVYSLETDRQKKQSLLLTRRVYRAVA
jgi:hypothetical protein